MKTRNDPLEHIVLLNDPLEHIVLLNIQSSFVLCVYPMRTFHIIDRNVVDNHFMACSVSPFH